MIRSRWYLWQISIDDKIDGLHYFTTLIKFGIGRCTFDVSHEIRNGYITRDEVVSKNKFDGELFPDVILKNVLNKVE